MQIPPAGGPSGIAGAGGADLAGSAALAGPAGVSPARDDAAVAYGLSRRLGPSGNVYEARSPRFEDRVAMKLYRRATGLPIAAAHAFAHDAARASSLRHPHIVQVIEAGTLRDGTPFATTEYLIGHTLEQQLEGRGAFLATELLPLIRGAASALSAVHAAGLAHRELRPDNIFIVELAGYESGFVKVLDFGACHLTAAQVLAGQELGARGSRYLAPEQLGAGRLDEVDPRADQFALAAIAYRMLSGTDSPATGVRGVAPLRPGVVAPVVVMPLSRRAPAVDAVVSKALSRAPEDRFESVALFLRAFEEALAGAALIVTPGPARADAGPAPSPEYPPPAPAPPSRPAPVAVREITALGERRSGPHRRDVATERPSLTQQFFEEGDRQESTRYQSARFDPSEFSSSAAHEFESFDRIPTRRAPLLVAVLLMLVAGAGIAWWAGLRPPQTWRESSWWRTLHLPVVEPATTATPTPPLSAPATDVPPTPAVAAPTAPPAAPAAPAAPDAAAAPAETGATTAPAAEPATPLPPAAEVAPEVASPSPQPQARDKERDSNAAAHPARQKTRRPEPVRPAAPQRTPALRGYTWSPERNSMVPSERNGSDPGPAPSAPSFESPASRSPSPPSLPPRPPADNGAAPPPFNP